MKIHKVQFNDQVMTVIDRSTEKPQLKTDPPASATFWARPDVTRTMEAIGMLARRVGPCESVLEPFGGVGWHSHYIIKHCGPTVHRAFDISADCVDSIKATHPSIEARVQDAWALDESPGSYDWVHTDAQSYTFNRFATGKKWAPLLDDVFKISRRYVSLTDSAVFGLVRFQKNRDAYAKLIGMDADNWTDYFVKTAECYRERYGFGTVYVVHWAGQACCVLFDREAGADDIEIVKAVDKADVKLIETTEVPE